MTLRGKPVHCRMMSDETPLASPDPTQVPAFEDVVNDLDYALRLLGRNDSTAAFSPDSKTAPRLESPFSCRARNSRMRRNADGSRDKFLAHFHPQEIDMSLFC